MRYSTGGNENRTEFVHQKKNPQHEIKKQESISSSTMFSYFRFNL